jgi:hypothetical protein
MIPTGEDGTALTLQKHYLAVDAVSWFVNQESSWFRDRAATGTLSITFGDESYHVALGLYEQKDGARIAPVFDKPVLPARAFKGGPITVQAVLSGVSTTTGLGKMLQEVASAALGVAGTMAQTATLAGPSPVLTAAGAAMIKGVRQLLDAQDTKLRLFDPTTGIEKTVQPADVRGPVTYLLLYRGDKLDPKKLRVATAGGTEQPTYDGRLLADGVWLLIRFRVTSEYPVEPVWLGRVRDWIADVERLADDVAVGGVTAEAARAKLTAGGDGTPSLYDTFRDLTAAVRADGVLTAAESGSYLGVLRAVRLLALRLVNGGNPAAFGDAMGQLRSGSLTDPDLRAAVAKAADEAARDRGVVTKAAGGVFGAADGSAPGPTLPIDDLPRLRAALGSR